MLMAILDLNLVTSKISPRHFIHYIVIHTEKHIWEKGFNFEGFLKIFLWKFKNIRKSTVNNISKLHIPLNPTSTVTILPVFTVCETYKESNFMFKNIKKKHSVQVDLLVYWKKCVWECELFIHCKFNTSNHTLGQYCFHLSFNLLKMSATTARKILVFLKSVFRNSELLVLNLLSLLVSFYFMYTFLLATFVWATSNGLFQSI